jgi:hypothetical protein
MTTGALIGVALAWLTLGGPVPAARAPNRAG